MAMTARTVSGMRADEFDTNIASIDGTTRLALMEEAKTLPLGAIWREHCARHNVPGDTSWIEEVKKYEASVLSKRG